MRWVLVAIALAGCGREKVHPTINVSCSASSYGFKQCAASASVLICGNPDGGDPSDRWQLLKDCPSTAPSCVDDGDKYAECKCVGCSSGGGTGGTVCCKHCGPTGKPCGDSCIDTSKNCNVGVGCACY